VKKNERRLHMKRGEGWGSGLDGLLPKPDLCLRQRDQLFP